MSAHHRAAGTATWKTASPAGRPSRKSTRIPLASVTPRVAEPEGRDDPERVPGAAAAPRSFAGLDPRAAIVGGERVRHDDAVVFVEHDHVLVREGAQRRDVVHARWLAGRRERLEDRAAQREFAPGHACVSDASSRRVRTPSLR